MQLGKAGEIVFRGILRQAANVGLYQYPARRNKEMSKTSYCDAKVLASALELLGKCVVVHWLDDDGETYGVAGTLKRIDPPHTSVATGKEVGKALVIEDAYAYVELSHVTLIEERSLSEK